MLNSAVLLLAASLALPIDAHRTRQRTTDSVPKLTLPWGTWEGKPYGDEDQTTVFKNVRFGQAPVGGLRFSAPKYPDAIEDPNQVQDSTYGPSCIRAVPTANVTFEPIGDGTQAEDCLFLDVYVPSWALDQDRGLASLPVIVWIYGGAYIFGSKDLAFELEDGNFQAYDGQGIAEHAQGGVIWVTGNYRMGAFGFLAGSTMEEEAQPNAGLHDQRLLLDWVQRYIGQVGGNNKSVNAWGLSAGAGSILHHLTAYGGVKTEEAPLFQRAVMWSPAFQWGYDRAGALEETFQNFTTKAKCSSSGALECLKKASTHDLAKANQEVVSAAIGLGMFPFGPAVDGDLVPELPAALLSKGKHNNCSSIIVSHDYDEVSMFLAKWVDTKEDFTQFLAYAFPGDALASIRQRIETQYPAKFFDFQQKNRMRRVLRDSTFVCNKRQIYNAFRNSSTVYTMRFDMPPAQHGFDMFAIIWRKGIAVSKLIKCAAPRLPDVVLHIADKIWPFFEPIYQGYYAAHAVTGDPNDLEQSTAPKWLTTVDDGNKLMNTMMIGSLAQYNRFFKSSDDSQSSTKNCAFWDEVATEISNLFGKEAMPLVSFREQFELR